MSAIFEPPYADTLPPTVKGLPGNGAAFLLLRHFKSRARGRSVLKTGGVYVTVDYPTEDEIDAADEAYIGGHVYVVDDETAAALEAAGYTLGEAVPDEGAGGGDPGGGGGGGSGDAVLQAIVGLGFPITEPSS